MSDDDDAVMVPSSGMDSVMVIPRWYARETYGTDLDRLELSDPSDERLDIISERRRDGARREAAANSPVSAFLMSAGNTASFGLLERGIGAAEGDAEGVSRTFSEVSEENAVADALGGLTGLAVTGGGLGLVGGGRLGITGLSALGGRAGRAAASALGRSGRAASIIERATQSVVTDAALSAQYQATEMADANMAWNADTFLANAGTDVLLGLGAEALLGGAGAAFRRIRSNSARRLLGDDVARRLLDEDASLRQSAGIGDTAVEDLTRQQRRQLVTESAYTRSRDLVRQGGDGVEDGMQAIRREVSELSGDGVSMGAATFRQIEGAMDGTFDAARRSVAQQADGIAASALRDVDYTGAIQAPPTSSRPGSPQAPPAREAAQEMIGNYVRTTFDPDALGAGSLQSIRESLQSAEAFGDAAASAHRAFLDRVDNLSASMSTGGVSEGLARRFAEGSVNREAIVAHLDDAIKAAGDFGGVDDSVSALTRGRSIVSGMEAAFDDMASYAKVQTKRREGGIVQKLGKSLTIYGTGAATSMAGMSMGGPLGGLIGGVLGRDFVRRIFGESFSAGATTARNMTRMEIAANSIRSMERIHSALRVIDDAIKRRLGPNAATALRNRTHESVSAYNASRHREERVEEFRPVWEMLVKAKNPENIQRQLEGRLSVIGELDPALMEATGMGYVRYMDYISRHLPMPFAPGFEPDVADIPMSQMDEFMRRYEALNDPYRIVELAAINELTTEHVETVREVFPELYTEILYGVATTVGDTPPSEMEHSVRQGLSTLLGAPIEPTRDARLVAALQSPAAQTRAQEEVMRGTPSTRRLSSIDGSQTRAQEIGKF